MSVRLAPVHPVGRLRRCSATAIAARRARRRRPDSRRRDGRPFRAQPDDRPAVVARHPAGRPRAARRPPDDHGPGSVYRRVRRGRGGDDLGPRRGAPAPAPRPSSAIKALGVKAGVVLNPVDARRGARGDRRRRRPRPRHVGQPGLRRPDVHPAQRAEGRATVRALLDRAGNHGADRGRRRHRSPAPSRRVVAAGARILVAGAAIFHTPDPERAARELKAAALGRRWPRRPPGDRAAHDDPAPRALRRNRPDGRRLLRQLFRLVRGRAHRAAAGAGWSYRQMEADGFVLPVIEAHCDYRLSARYDDEIEMRSERIACSPRCASSSTTRSSGRRTRPGWPPGTPFTPRSTGRAGRAACPAALREVLA